MSDLLDDVHALRRRARADRNAYWLPLLFFGAVTAASAPFYVIRWETPANPGDLYSGGPDQRLPAYWTVVLVAGALLTLWWYRRRGLRVGLEGPAGIAVAAAGLAVAAYSGVMLALSSGLQAGPAQVVGWVSVRERGALLILAVGLLALTVVERSLLLGIVAVAFAALAVVVNYTDLPGPAPVSLLVPAAVLLAGGAAAGLRSLR